MIIIEKGLIPIYEDNSRQVVDARELHEFLEVGKNFTDWIKYRILQYGFVAGEDFITNLGESTGGRPSVQYILTLDTAKEIAMVENNEKGRIIRKYFIEVENRAKQPKQMTQAELIFGLAQCNVELEKKILTLDNKVTNALEVFTKATEPSWKESMNTILNGMVKANGLNYQTFKGDLYAELDRIAQVDITTRQTRLRNRMKQQGHTSTDIKAVTKLDIIDHDAKLRVIFEGIVRKYQAKYAVA
jgi:phage anti-repressor protein